MPAVIIGLNRILNYSRYHTAKHKYIYYLDIVTHAYLKSNYVQAISLGNLRRGKTLKNKKGEKGINWKKTDGKMI